MNHHNCSCVDVPLLQFGCCLLKYHFLFYVSQFLQSISGIESHKGNVSADMSVHFVSGGLAGITAASATYPLDLVRTRLAAQVMSTLC